MIESYIQKKWIVTGTIEEHMKEPLRDFLYQIHMREGTTEYSPMILFNHQMLALIPLGVKEKLARDGLEIPVSFVYGDNDWVQMIEEDIADTVTSANKYFYEEPDEESEMDFNKNEDQE